MVHILPGSLEITANGTVTAGVHIGGSDWNIVALRYITLNKEDWLPGEVLIQALDRVYDNSTGSVLTKDFKLN